ncbi:MAG: CpsB/CapC family capsule biosynthesis tyrosine phosphatase [Ruthenibacterium sp.]
MTDLHCHILPGIDDGAQSMEVSLALLEQQKKQGVTQIAYTPHFRCDRQSVDGFLRMRQESMNLLQQETVDKGFSFGIKLGAEAYFSPALTEIDLKPICLQGTNVLLIELPVEYNSSFTMDVLYQIQLHNITPMIAHIERYSYAMQDMAFIYALANAGCIIQANAASIAKNDARAKAILKLIRWNLVHIIASDAHSAQRPSQMHMAADFITAKLGAQAWQQLDDNAACVFAGTEFVPDDLYCPHKLLGRWI